MQIHDHYFSGSSLETIFTNYVLAVWYRTLHEVLNRIRSLKCNIATVKCGNLTSVYVVPWCYWLLLTGCIKNRGLHFCTINTTVTTAEVTYKSENLHKHQSTWQRDSTNKRVWFIHLTDFYKRIVHIATFLLRKIFYKDEIREKRKLQVLM